MAHITEIVRIHEPGDGILALTVRCCGDPKTDSVLTIYRLDRGTDAIDQDIAAHRARVAQQHENKALAKAHVERLSGIKADCNCP